MANEFIVNEFNKILDNSDFSPPLDLAMGTACIAANLKGLNIKIINLENKSSLADFFVLASATNITQAQAIADQICRITRGRGHRTLSVEGQKDGEWILIDFGNVIVHIFLEQAREIFNLDGLFASYSIVPIPQEFYFGVSPVLAEDVEAQFVKDYF
jgi:ribosome-associated protein